MNRIKEVMEEKGIKQTWLSERLGKSYSQVNGYVQNRHQPRLEVLFQIAEILGVEVKFIKKYEENSKYCRFISNNICIPYELWRRQ
jgi:putative transcriptional regulator